MQSCTTHGGSTRTSCPPQPAGGRSAAEAVRRPRVQLATACTAQATAHVFLAPSLPLLSLETPPSQKGKRLAIKNVPTWWSASCARTQHAPCCHGSRGQDRDKCFVRLAQKLRQAVAPILVMSSSWQQHALRMHAQVAARPWAGRGSSMTSRQCRHRSPLAYGPAVAAA